MKKIGLFLTVAALSLLLSITVFCADAQGSLDSVELGRNLDTLHISASFDSGFLGSHKGETLYVFALAPYQSSSLNQLDPVSETKISASPEYTISFDGKDSSELFARFVLALRGDDGKYYAVTNERYIDNISAGADSDFDYPDYVSKKGLQIQLLSDAQELGVSHTVLNIPINEYLLGQANSNSTAYVYNGKTYYIDGGKLELLDHKIKVMSEAGINIYLNFYLTSPSADTPKELLCLYYDGALESGASICAVNLSTADAFGYYAGFLRFIAARYTDKSGQHGFAGSFIIGYEANMTSATAYCGALSPEEYTDMYIRTYRVADTALRSAYANGRTYVSVSNLFNAVSAPSSADSDNLLTDNVPPSDIGAKEFLTLFAEKVKASGDIPWRIAINPYPSDITSYTFWRDEKATDSPVSEYLTMKNLSVLSTLLNEDIFKYNGTKRSFVISEFGMPGVYGEDTEKVQAAAFVYAYYITVFNPDAEAIIWHRQVDHSGENGLNYGLWSAKTGMLLTPENKKAIYNVFKYIDTKKEGDTLEDIDALTSFALSYINAKSWPSVIPGYTRGAAAVKTVYESISYSEEEVAGGYNSRKLFDFTRGNLYTFYPTDNAQYIELNTAQGDNDVSLYAKMYNVYSTEYMGIGSYFSDGISLKKAGYISVRLMAEAPEDVTSVNVLLRMQSASGKTLFEGVAQIAPGKWTVLTFKINGFTGAESNISSLKLWVKPGNEVSYSYNENCGLWLSEVTLHESSSGSFLITLLIILIVLAAISGILILIMTIRARRRIARYRKAQLQRRAAQSRRIYDTKMKNAARAEEQMRLSEQQRLRIEAQRRIDSENAARARSQSEANMRAQRRPVEQRTYTENELRAGVAQKNAGSAPETRRVPTANRVPAGRSPVTHPPINAANRVPNANASNRVRHAAAPIQNSPRIQPDALQNEYENDPSRYNGNTSRTLNGTRPNTDSTYSAQTPPSARRMAQSRPPVGQANHSAQPQTARPRAARRVVQDIQPKNGNDGPNG